MTAYLLDWCALLVRWLHIVAGIAWIGASFYFVWLDNHLQAPAAGAGGDPGVAGELWAVHGGGFYRSQKYRLAPAVLPPTLHWFYWEAYTTWLSGFGLLCLLYFWRAEAYLIDPSVALLTKPAAIAIGLGALLASWLLYDALCRSPLGRHPRMLATALAAGIATLAWGLCHLFSGRGAFMLFGSSLGTIMVANVLFVIIPGQRELVLAKQQGRALDPAPGLRGKQRSVHNTYFTLPVLFVMISNHYAITYGARYNWLVLAAMSFAGACIRAWFVARHRPAAQGSFAASLPAVVGVVTLAGVVVALAPPGAGSLRARGGTARGDVSAAGVPGSLAYPSDVPMAQALPSGAAPVAGAPAAEAPPVAAASAARALAFGSATGAEGSPAEAPPVDIVRVQHIVEQRCVPCHATSPTQPGFSSAPNGVVLQTVEQLRAHLPEVRQQLAMRTMPLGNLTGMTDAERELVLMWIGHGAGS
jgi:uncharacterized membrane protein